MLLSWCPTEWGNMVFLHSPSLNLWLTLGHLSSSWGSSHPKTSAIKELSFEGGNDPSLETQMSLWSCYKSNPHNSSRWSKYNSYLLTKHCQVTFLINDTVVGSATNSLCLPEKWFSVSLSVNDIVGINGHMETSKNVWSRTELSQC